MPGPLAGTTAVVTGASSGIGARTARALASAGATVALIARRRASLETVASEITAVGGAASVHPADLAEPGAAVSVIDETATRHGGIDVLVHSAGYGMWGPAVDADLAQWRKMVDVNLTGVLAVTHAALPHLLAAAQGPRGVADLVAISSIAGRKVPSSASNVYSATKFAVGAFCEALRQELAPRHVRVGLIEPGVVETELTTKGGNNAPDATALSALARLSADDVAEAVHYMVTRPDRVAVNELLVRPLEQVI